MIEDKDKDRYITLKMKTKTGVVIDVHKDKDNEGSNAVAQRQVILSPGQTIKEDNLYTKSLSSLLELFLRLNTHRIPSRAEIRKSL